jgi:hypothetical protein
VQFQIHVGKSRNLGPILLYSAFDSIGSANNVLDTTSPIVASCPSERCRVGVLPDGRTVYIDGVTESPGPINVNINALGKQATIQVEVIAAEPSQFPAAIVVDTSMVGPEYATPPSR